MRARVEMASPFATSRSWSWLHFSGRVASVLKSVSNHFSMRSSPGSLCYRSAAERARAHWDFQRRIRRIRQIVLLERPHWSRGCLCSPRTARSARRRRFEQSGELLLLLLLLHRYRLRQISRLIDVAPAPDCDVISQQLQRDDLQDRRQFFRRRRNEEHVISFFGDLFVAFGGKRDNYTGTSLYFFQIRHRFFVTDHRLRTVHVARGNDDNREILVNQRIRAVLHLPRRITFGVNVGNFLELERAFERYRIVNAAS